MDPTYKGRRILMETLLAEGVEYVFGNPGTTELPLVDSLTDYPAIQYILALQEAVAVTMADAYAQMSGKVGVVNLHVGPGLGNGIGSIYGAWEGGTPLVVTAGQQDTRMRLREPLLGHDLVAMAAPVTKWSVEANNAGELALVLHRAFKTAREAPTGPVFVALPINVMEEETAHGPLAPSRLFPRLAPDAGGLREAAELLLRARHPLVVCGDRVARCDAVNELVALVELVGADVYNEVLPSRINFPIGHPQYRDRGAGDQAQLRKMFGKADTILLVGGDFFEEVWYLDEPPFPEDAALIQIDPFPGKLGHNYPVDCGLLGDPKLALQGLTDEIGGRADDAFHEAAAARRERFAGVKAEENARQQARADKHRNQRPMSPARLMEALSAAAPPDVAVVGEAITSSADLTRSFQFAGPQDYLASRGGGIGQALPSGIGMKLAQPDRPVLAISGDGSSLYTIQALWSAAHHKLPVVFVILNNRTYRILKINMNRYRSIAGLGGERPYRHLDLTEPEMDYVSIAHGFGLEAAKIEAPEDIGPAVNKAFASETPWLLDILVDGSV